MAARVVWLVVTGALRPSQILCLTFTNKASEELSRRVRDATASLGLDDGDEATVLTYHAFGQRLLEDYGTRIGVEPGAMLLTDAHRWQIAASLLENRQFEHVEVRTVGTVLGYCLKLNDECADHGVTPDDVIAFCRRQIENYATDPDLDDVVQAARKRWEVAELVRDYRERKRAINAVDYGDLIALANRLVEESPDVVNSFRARYPSVLLDEYQDTNVAQARLLGTLCGPNYPIFAVGDPDQNIYAWRGASLRNILRFGDDFGGAEAKPLYVNFRSGSRILAVANAVIERVPAARRPPGKVLEPHESRGEGRVLAFAETDERAEARRIAEMIREHVPSNEDGPRWSDVAILCRKKRLFPPFMDIFREEDIPFEVVDLGGLLKLPEIVDVVAWLRVLDDPASNVYLVRILQGPRWRIGYRDLVALARWSAQHTHALRRDLGLEERPGDVAFPLAEALEHLDDVDMEALSEEGRARLREFRVLLAELRERARGPLPDLVGAIVERSGLAGELDAASTAAGHTARRNVTNFLEFVTSFAPVGGDATLSTLVTWLDAADQVEDQMEPAQPSASNTVKILTIHKAKGLEWPVVFVPGMAEHERWGSDIFPDVDRQPNPLRRPEALPYELRGDADVLPRFDGADIKGFKQALRNRSEEEERRLCYVALTRARDVLVVSRSWWYGENSDVYQPGRFWREVAERTETERILEAERPEENPLIEWRASLATSWPPAATAEGTDALFPDGWHSAAREAMRRPESVRERVASLDVDEQRLFEETADAARARAEAIGARLRPQPDPVPEQVSVTSLIDYVRCPKFFYWSVVRPLPRRPSAAARLGSDMHRWIELRSRGQLTLLEADDVPDLTTDERSGEPSPESQLRDAWQSSRFADRAPLFAERSFLLYVDGFVVGGRIDAVFAEASGRWEIVDYKTGRRPADDDPTAGLQLDVYALAASEVWGKRAEDLQLTYFYLEANEIVSRPSDPIEDVRKRVVSALGGIAQRAFNPEPGRHCRWCDFLSFCGPGRAHIRSSG